MKYLFYILIGLYYVSGSLVFAQNENKVVRKGNNFYEQENYAEAETQYLKALEENAQSTKALYNLGNAQFKQSNFEGSMEAFANTANNQSLDDNLRADAYYNLGNGFVKTQQFDKAIDAYKNSLLLDPDDMDCKYNLCYAQKMLQEQQQQQQNQDQNEENDDQNEDQDKQNQQQKDDQQKEEDQKQEQDNQNQEQQQKEQQQQEKKQQTQPVQISKQEAEQMLQALENDEKETMDKLKEIQLKKVKAKNVEKDW